jgi:uncharacterized protein YjiS (DUF1127 family)
MGRTISHSDTFTSSLPDRTASAASFKERLARWRAARRMYAGQRQTAAMLASLDDRALKDIGFTRSEIDSAASDCTGDRLRRYDPGWIFQKPAR